MTFIRLNLHLHSESWIEKTENAQEVDGPELEALREANTYIRESGVSGEYHTRREYAGWDNFQFSSSAGASGPPPPVNVGYGRCEICPAPFPLFFFCFRYNVWLTALLFEVFVDRAQPSRSLTALVPVTATDVLTLPMPTSFEPKVVLR